MSLCLSADPGPRGGCRGIDASGSGNSVWGECGEREPAAAAGSEGRCSARTARRGSAVGPDRGPGRSGARDAETPDITVEELRAALAGRGQLRLWDTAALLRPPPDHAQKTAHASEQDRPDILKRREAWFERQPDLDPAWLVIIDETRAKFVIQPMPA